MIKSRKKMVIWAIVLVVVTAVATFTISNVTQIAIGDKILISRQDAERLIETNKKYEKAEFLKEFIQENFLYDVSEEELLEGALKGIFEALEDPYSIYMTEEEFSDFMEHTAGVYSGIGIIVVPGDDNLITVVAPIEGTPGERAGIKTGDKIIRVNGKEFTADKMDDAIKVMKGQVGTDVKLGILRKDKDGNSEILDMDVTREQIRQKTVKAQMLDNNIGYIRITSFDEKTYGEFDKELKTLEKNQMQGLVIDLRNNPGGLLDQCKKITDELMGKGTIVYTKTKQGEKDYLNSDKDKIDVPLVVLVNGGSASASEILAGAIKDTESGTLVGTKTFGKGIVQRILPLSDGSGLKMTTSEYFTPNGINIHGIGIEPNVVIELPEDVEYYGVDYLDEDVQLQKAIEIIQDKVK